MNLWNLIMLKVKELFESHITDSSAHHTKYTDAEAVSAADASDKFIEQSVENIVTDITTLRKNVTGYFAPTFLKTRSDTTQFASSGSVLDTYIRFINHTYQQSYLSLKFPSVTLQGTDSSKIVGALQFLKDLNALDSYFQLTLIDSVGSEHVSLKIYHDKLDVRSSTIKDIKNHADAALSGTPKIIEFDIGGTPYYVKVYPTKT